MMPQLSFSLVGKSNYEDIKPKTAIIIPVKWRTLNFFKVILGKSNLPACEYFKVNNLKLQLHDVVRKKHETFASNSTGELTTIQ